MIKKSIVLVEFLIVLVLGALTVAQLGLSPERARAIDRREPLWFMNPWRPGGKETPPAGHTVKAQLDDSARGEATRRYVLSPTPAINAMVTDLANSALQPVTRVLDTSAKPQDASAVREKVEKREPEPRKHKDEALPTGTIRITNLTISSDPAGVRITGTTSSPVGEMDLVTYTSPPRVIVELHGRFARYGKRIEVPPNPCIRSVSTLPASNRMRLVVRLLTPATAIAPVARASKDGFEINLVTPGQNTAAQPPAKE